MAQLIPLLGIGAGAAGTLSTIATVAGPVMGIMGALAGAGEARAQANEFERQGTEERLVANINAEKTRRAARQEQSKSRAAMAESGALSGTAQGVLDQNAVAQELDALTVEFQGEQRGKAADFSATEARKRGSFLNVISAGVEGFSSMDPLNIGGIT